MKMEDFFPKKGFVEQMNTTLVQMKEGKIPLTEKQEEEEIKDFKEEPQPEESQPAEVPQETEEKQEEEETDRVKLDKTISLKTVERFLNENIGKETVFSYGKKAENMLVVASKGKLRSAKFDGEFLEIKFEPNFTFFIADRKVKTIQFGTIKGKPAYFIRGHEKQDNLIIRI